MVLKGTEINFYKDQKSYHSTPSSTFKGEPAIEILGAKAAVAPDYTKKENVFRLRYTIFLIFPVCKTHTVSRIS